MINRLQVYFNKQSRVVKLISAIAIPIVFFIIAYELADHATLYTEDFGAVEISHPFRIRDTGFIWIGFVVATALLQYCIWQPLENKNLEP